MTPFAILAAALFCAAGLAGIPAGWDTFSLAAITTIGVICGFHLYFTTYGETADVRKAILVYLTAAVVVTEVTYFDARYWVSLRPQSHVVSVFYNGTCETVKIIKDIPGALMVYDGESYAYLRRESITAVSPVPGCLAQQPGQRLG
jgi:hypothetical protein